MSLRKVERGTEPLRGLIAIAGASNSGKTFSALRMASGLVETLGGKIALVDTELRGNLYHHRFAYDHFILEPPFSPKAWMETYRELDGHYSVIISDNFSDEYEGPGGIAEMAVLSPLRNDIAKWAQPKAEHKALMAKIRLLKSQHIFLLRASDKIEIFQDRDEHGQPVGKQLVRPLGWQPHAEKNFKYDITLGWMLFPESQGRGNVWKQVDGFDFADGEQLSEDHGQRIAAWIKGGSIIRETGKEADMGELVTIFDADGSKFRTTSVFQEAVDAYRSVKAATKGSSDMEATVRALNRDSLMILRSFAGPKAGASIDRELGAAA